MIKKVMMIQQIKYTHWAYLKRGTNEFLELPLIYKNEENYKSFHLPLADLNKILYKKLCEFLEIDYNKNGPFKPLYFFQGST